jgi:hypothetical protein
MTFQQIRQAALVGSCNMIAGTSVASLSLLATPQKMMQYLADSLFLHRAMSGRRGVPQKNVSEVLRSGGTVSIRLGNLDTSDAWLWPQALYTQDIVSLCLICQIIKPKVVFEIGTAQGYTAHHFALNTPDEARVYTLDLPRDRDRNPTLPTTLIDTIHIQQLSQNERFRFDGSPEASKITCLSEDSATFDFKPYYGGVDFFFIDGAHSYEYARSDTLNAVACCHPGSVIAWHDYGKASLPGVTRCVDEFTRGRAAYSIPGGSIAFMTVD